ncbi:hypothetical protein, partial [Klebsiella pneumoniae]|uniref:hypothetical protein n=1 Tax=Klebsiella pneumoniae TaxID=573 RepID=UPI001C6FA5B7
NLRMSTRFCTKGDGFQFLAKFAILPQNANSRCLLYNRIIIHNHDDYVVLMAGEIDECGP